MSDREIAIEAEEFNAEKLWLVWLLENQAQGCIAMTRELGISEVDICCIDETILVIDDTNHRGAVAMMDVAERDDDVYFDDGETRKLPENVVGVLRFQRKQRVEIVQRMKDRGYF